MRQRARLFVSSFSSGYGLLDADGANDDAIEVAAGAAVKGSAAGNEGERRANVVVEDFRERSSLGAILLDPGYLILQGLTASEVQVNRLAGRQVLEIPEHCRALRPI